MSATDDAAGEKASDGQSAVAEAPPKLKLEVKIEKRGACQRHIVVTIPRDDIDRYFDNAFDELMPKAQVSGFRPGRAPRKLVESKFRKEVADQVKGSLLVDTLGQVSEGDDLSPISEPDFDPVAVVLPDDGPMTFEFDIEVRPEFDLPNWKGLTIERPVHEFTGDDIDRYIRSLLADHARLSPVDTPARPGDYVTANFRVTLGDEVLCEAAEQTLCLRPKLSFHDAQLEGFDRLLAGATPGERRTAELAISADAPNEAARGEQARIEFEVLEVKQLELPELSAELLQRFGDFDDEAAFRRAIRENLERRLRYQQHRTVRRQVTALLTEAADWELPPDLLRRQSRREFDRAVLELQSSGFSEAEVRAHANELMQNSQAATVRALKEHFILERIAEEESVTDTPDDYEFEIRLIAMQSGESPRRVRARLEKGGLMDSLRNQIIERKVIELILSQATFRDRPADPLEEPDTEAVDLAAAGGQRVDDIPEARYADQGGPAPGAPQRG